MQLTQRQAVIALFLIQVSAGTISLGYFALIAPQSSVLRGLIIGLPAVIILFIVHVLVCLKQMMIHGPATIADSSLLMSLT